MMNLRNQIISFYKLISNFNRLEVDIKLLRIYLSSMKINTNDLQEHLNPLEDKQQSSDANYTRISEETFKYLKKLEGDCRISRQLLLKINYAKMVLLAFPFALTFIGLIILYQFKAVRCALLFDKLLPSQKHVATHIMVHSSSGITGICRITRKQWKGKTAWLFCFQQLLYELYEETALPLAIKISEQAKAFLSPEYISQGLSVGEASLRLQFYGSNIHLVKIPTYHQYLFNVFFISLFSYIQYFTTLIYMLENLLFYGILLIIINFLTASINYVLIRISYKSIKEIAQKKHYVEVLRQGSWKTIENSQLVPGDLYKPSDLIACDSIVVRQDLFVSEVGFTGQSIPIGKFTLTDMQRVFEAQNWVYEGSEIISMKGNCFLMAVNTGYSTRKGLIIRKILQQKPVDNDLFKSIIQQSTFMLVIMVCCYFIFYHHMFDGIEQNSLIYILFGSFVIQSLPAALPIFLNTSFTIFLLRLRTKQIMGLKREKTIESSRLETICFDKTGTLTQNGMEIKSILLPNQQIEQFQRVQPSILANHTLLHRLFATCHSVQNINNKFHGDEIDLEMFKAAKVSLKDKKLQEGTVFEVFDEQSNGASMHLEVLRVHQFESRFQSMSVVVKDKISGEAFVFAKGAPEKLHAVSTVHFPHFSDAIRELSLEGLRSIAVSAKRVDAAEALRWEREQCLEGTSLIAFVTFANALKTDAAETIATLSAAAIGTKMVTGDNIFVAIQTALSLQMVPNGSRIIALQGARLRADGGISAVAVRREDSKIVEEEVSVDELTTNAFEGEFIAMDFDFLKRSEAFFLQRSATVFARATPQTKAVILKKEKERIAAHYAARSWRSRFFGGRIRKVAMVGDGANDLMAIREADVGIGISDSDAVYSADFAITQLKQVIQIILEGRAGESKIIEIILFTQYTYFIGNVLSVLTTSDMSIMAFVPTLLKNFGLIYFSTILIAITAPVDELTPYCPSFNLMGLEYMLIWWGNAVIIAGGMGLGYFQYFQSNDFSPNPDRSSLNGFNKSATITFLQMYLITLLAFISFIGSRPFKKPLYTNRPLCIMLAFSFCMITVFYFFTEHLHFLQLEHIGMKEAVAAYLISLCTGCLCIAYVCVIRSFKLFKNQFPEPKGGLKKLKELTLSI